MAWIQSAVARDAGRQWALRLLVPLVLLAVLQVLPVWQPLQRLEYDLFSSLTAPVRPDAGVVVIGIDEPSLATLQATPPLPRRLHAQLIDALSASGAAGLGIDLLLSTAQSPEDDAALGRALQGRMPVALASAQVAVQSGQVAQYQQSLRSIFDQALHGDVGMHADDDGVQRSAPGQSNAMWRVLAQAAGRTIVPPPPGALLRYYAPEVALPYVHYTQALDPARMLAPGALQGRLLLLGQNTPVGGVDQFATPLRTLGHGTQSGVMLHATALINGLTGDWIVPAHPALPLLQAAAAIALVAALTRRWRGWLAVWLSVALALLALIGGLCAYLQGVWWPTLPTLLALVLHFNVGATDSYWRERRQRERLRLDFGRYVPPAVVSALIASGAAPAISGERRELTLLFSDLAGFTSASERLPPEAVARALNAYFTRMTYAVHRHGGTLDKFIGDAVMAFWNAPVAEPQHAARALACAQEMQVEMDALRSQWAGTPFADLQLRIGLHTGEAAVGHLGSEGRFTYTAVGDAVNTAARLEGANKAFGTGILLSEATRSALPQEGNQALPLAWLDAVVLAGRSSGIDVYTPCDDAPLVATSLALQAHVHAGRWDEALACCAEWRHRAEHMAPLWVAQADRLQAQVQALADDRAPAAAGADAFAHALEK